VHRFRERRWLQVARSPTLLSSKACTKCGEIKPPHDFRILPSGNRQGMCNKCGNAFSKAWREECLAKNLCGSCKREPRHDGGCFCEKCHARTQARRRAKRAQNLAAGGCAECVHGKAIPGSTRCAQCRFKDRARYVWGDASRWPELAAIWEKQNGRCPYTGMQMNLPDADLDHIVPRAKGGSNDPGNLQWVLRPINGMKDAYLEGEFLDYIKIMYRHCVAAGKIKVLNESLVPKLKVVG
jgi:hypothetical protein